MASTVPHQIHLGESEMPTQWYNLIADLPYALAFGFLGVLLFFLCVLCVPALGRRFGP